MGTVVVHRPARHAVPDPGGEPVVVAAPPQLGEPPAVAMSAAMIVMPVVSGAGSLLITLTNANRPLFAAAGLLFLVASVALGAVMFASTKGSAKRRLREQRERYLDYLEELRHTLRGVTLRHRQAAGLRHPEPGLLLDAARLPARRWERRAGDPDFLDLRWGTGVRPLARPLELQVNDAEPLIAYDPVGLDAAKQLVSRYGHLPNQPLSINLAGCGTLSVVGDRAAGRGLARALLAQLVTFHSPDDVRVMVVRHPRLAPEWDWVKWLPHAMDERRGDASVPRPLVAVSTAALADLLADELEQRREDLQRRRGQPPGPGVGRLVVVVDGEYQVALAGLDGGSPSVSPADLGIHLVVLVGARREEPETIHERLSVSSDGTVRRESDDATGTLDAFSAAESTSLARELCPVRLAETDADLLHTSVALADVLGVADVATLDPGLTWRPRPTRDSLRVPIGLGADGTPVWLDLKESAFGGMGPHGLVIGATGSGKSEMLRTLVSSLVIAHPPDELALLLVDFKGGATFADLAGLPHLAGMITNLADDIVLVDRFREALTGELARRQEILKAAGNLPNLHAYRQQRRAEPDVRTAQPLPHLLVIIDEFSELLAAKPDFAEVFVAVGRIGRSIGVHLLLATQRLEVGRIRGLESHLSYRIGLRTFSEAESREAIGVPDAYHLPPEPGSGYVKVDTTIFERFKAAMVSEPYRPPQRSGRRLPVLPYPIHDDAGVPLGPVTSADRTPGGPSTLQVIVSRLSTTDPAPSADPTSGSGKATENARRAAPVRPVWLPPLPPAVALDTVLSRLSPVEGEVGPDRMVAPLGLEDAPREQQQTGQVWDFTGAEGNLLVLGAPLSGKSTLVRTLLAGLALSYPPGQAACFCVDYGGGALAPFAALPHVAAVASRAEPDRVRRTIDDVRASLDRREALFRRHGLDSAAALRRARARGIVPRTEFGDVFLIVDGWGTLREADPDLEDLLVEIVSRGPAFGIHTILTVVGAAQVRVRLSAHFGGRIELRLSDPFDSAVDRHLAADLPPDTPGRALLVNKRYLQVALPRIDGAATTDDLSDAVSELITTVCRRWPDARVPLVQVLPELVDLDALPGAANGTLPIGLSERDLGPAGVNLFGADPHLIVYGDPQTGKSSLLRGLLHQLVRHAEPDRLGIMLVDYRRSLLGVVPEEYLLGYCTTAKHTAQAAAALVGDLAKRMPGPDVTAHELRDRSWWRGLEVVVVVDDYDLVATTGGNPLAPLGALLTQGRDLGLHLVLARRTGGAARFQYEPVLQALNDMSSPGLLFSGDRMEGRLVAGVASQRLPVGRAVYARRGEPAEQVQIGWISPPDGAD